MSILVAKTHKRLTASAGALRCRRKFLRFFPDGFGDETYFDWERGYKLAAHQQWLKQLSADEMQSLVRQREFIEAAARAVRIESRTNLLFSFEKMALRDAVRSEEGAKSFITGLYDFVHGAAPLERRFVRWIEAIASLPRRQTRVLTWPLVTVFGFIADPKTHIFLKPTVTRRAAEAYGFAFDYRSSPNYATYASLLEFARTIKRDLRELKPPPRDMIDVQSFVWVQGSDEYD